ncbi:hypothetical protein CCB81_05640 [Armatimonadetes bacterium Uphvl-Ar2]|nr:hypothetical protein CCB81_05640 [Armatimonadetes bacterium Uphvl-Ar2]
MSVLASVMLGMLLISGAEGTLAQTGDRPVARLRVGDEIAVRVVAIQGYDGNYTVLSDGSVVGLGFGRIAVEGKTIAEVRTAITARMRRILREPVVEVVLAKQRLEYVYVSGVNQQSAGPVELAEGMDLRALISRVALPAEVDEYDVALFRRGERVIRLDLAGVLSGSESLGATILEPNDVVTVAKADRVRVWVTGSVVKSGELLLRPGSDVYQAVAAAGGPLADIINDPDLALSVRRGPETIPVPTRLTEGQAPLVLQPGDTVSVTVPTPIRVAIGGEVLQPDELKLRPETTLSRALAQAGGPTPIATLKDVLVIRGQEAFRLDVSGTVTVNGPVPEFVLQDGDAVFVRRNERIVVVLGKVNKAGDVRMEDNREYRLADAVAAAGGVAPNGSTMRVYLARRTESGRVEVVEYRLEAFLKDGNMEQNPIVQEGDVVVVGEPKGLTAGAAIQVISAASILRTIFGN